MISNLMSMVSMSATVDTAAVEVLPHCPYHAQIDAWRAFRDEFLETQGLVDMQEFEVRKNILSREKAVAIEELIYREDTKMLIDGAKRMVNVLADYFQLYSTIYHSDNWSIEFDRLKHTNWMQFGMEIYTTYGTAMRLWKDAQYAAAGKAVADGLFPTVQEKSGNVAWDPLPYNKPYPGEEVAGYVDGMIYQFTLKHNTDNLASCLSEQDELLGMFEGAAESLMKRYNDDVIEGVTELNSVYASLGDYVKGCSKETIDQIAAVQERVNAVEEDMILSNLEVSKKHVELTYAFMKMEAAQHDFSSYGQNLAEYYLTVTGN